MLRVLIADPNPDFRRILLPLLEQEKTVEIVGISSDGRETLHMIRTLHPDIVLLELIQPLLDGIGILRRLAEEKSSPPVIVLTGFVNEWVVAECAALGAAYFMPKPCDTAELIERLRRYGKKGTPAVLKSGVPAGRSLSAQTIRLPAEDYSGAVTDLLHELGVPAHIKGYACLREAILHAIRDADAIGAVTKVLYPAVAKKLSTTASCVERVIRHAVEVAWDRGDEEQLQKLFGSSVSARTGKPTNREFIAILAEHTLRRMER